MSYSKLIFASITFLFFQTCFASQSINLDAWNMSFTDFVTNPHSAYILMLIAIYGLFFEIANPGFILPGVLGFLALVIALYAFQLLPVDYNGLTLLLVGISLMMLETFIPSYGAPGILGVISFISGSVMMFDIHYPEYQLMVPVIIAMSLFTTAFFLTALSMMRRAHKREVLNTESGLIGSEAIVLSIMNKQITVKAFGELWEAVSTEPLKQGEKVRVVRVHGLTLMVEPEKHFRSR